MDTKKLLAMSGLTALGASLCCVAPLVLVTLGIGGAWLATLTSLEPLRPVFVVLTLALLGLAWRRLPRSTTTCEPDTACSDPVVRRLQKRLFWSVAGLLLLLLAFPWYAFIFY